MSDLLRDAERLEEWAGRVSIREGERGVVLVSDENAATLRRAARLLRLVEEIVEHGAHHDADDAMRVRQMKWLSRGEDGEAEQWSQSRARIHRLATYGSEADEIVARGSE